MSMTFDQGGGDAEDDEARFKKRPPEILSWGGGGVQIQSRISLRGRREVRQEYSGEQRK